MTTETVIDAVVRRRALERLVGAREGNAADLAARLRAEARSLTAEGAPEIVEMTAAVAGRIKAFAARIEGLTGQVAFQSLPQLTEARQAARAIRLLIPGEP